MAPSADTASAALAAWLRERSAAVKGCEQRAKAALYDDNNESAYREQMRQKASLLAAAAGEAAPLLNALSGPEKDMAREHLEAFSRNAATALRLDSVFYMSALLYPDDHREGEPDNLEKLIRALA